MVRRPKFVHARNESSPLKVSYFNDIQMPLQLVELDAHRLSCYIEGPMEKVVQVFTSFDDAERADSEYYRSISPKERLNIALELAARYRASLGEAAERFERVHRIVELSQS